MCDGCHMSEQWKTLGSAYHRCLPVWNGKLQWHDAQALGLAMFVKSYKFVAGLEHLVTLADHFTPAIVYPDLLKGEWELFKNSVGASDSLFVQNRTETQFI